MLTALGLSHAAWRHSRRLRWPPEMQGNPSRIHRDGNHLSHHVRHAPSLSWVSGEGMSHQKLEFLRQFHIKAD